MEPRNRNRRLVIGFSNQPGPSNVSKPMDKSVSLQKPLAPKPVKCTRKRTAHVTILSARDSGSMDIIKCRRKDLSKLELQEITAVEKIYYFVPGLHKPLIGKEGHPLNLDDELGRYKIIVDDHIAYRYKIKNLLGRGTYGSVTEVIDFKYNKKRAIKIFRKGPYANDAINAAKVFRFLKGAEKKEGMKSIVRYFDNFIFRDHHCLTFELLYMDLKKLLKQKPEGLDLVDVQTIIKCVLKALDFIHSNDIIHGDVKPSNIMLKSASSYECKLIDFDMSYFINDPNISRYGVLQAMAYKSPEVMLKANSAFSTKIDVFSTGIIATELAKGRLIFDSTNEIKQMMSYIAYLGYPSRALAQHSHNQRLAYFINPARNFIRSIPDNLKCKPLTKKLFDDLPKNLDFISFIGYCLKMDPNKRKTAKELLVHPWITKEQLPQQTKLPSQTQKRSSCNVQ